LDAAVSAPSARRERDDEASSASNTTQAQDQRRYAREEAEPIVQTASQTGEWIELAAMALVFLGICAAAAHFVGLIPTLVGVLVIVWVIVRSLSSTLNDSTDPWKFRD
jgi:hypothetical protein